MEFSGRGGRERRAGRGERELREIGREMRGRSNEIGIGGRGEELLPASDGAAQWRREAAHQRLIPVGCDSSITELGSSSSFKPPRVAVIGSQNSGGSCLGDRKPAEDRPREKMALHLQRDEFPVGAAWNQRGKGMRRRGDCRAGTS